jgi:hypothetical protein
MGSIVGQDYMREGDLKSATAVFKLASLAYPDSADANDTVAAAYLKRRTKRLDAARC